MSTPETWFQTGEALVSGNRYGTPGFTEGLELLKKAAAAGFLEAQVALGHVYSQVHLLPDAATEAARWYRLAAEQNHPAAQDRLADLYMTGCGVLLNDAEAFQWYARTANQTYAMAQCNLAYMHTQGLGVPSDDVQATTLYLKAAAQGEGRAYFNLGLRYAAGLGASVNRVQACAWMANAARLNYPTSTMELDTLTTRLSDAERMQVRELTAAIEANFTALQYALGRTPGATASIEAYRAVVEQNFAALGVDGFSLDAAKRLQQADGADDHDRDRHAPDQPVTVCEQPRIFTVDEFVSKSEAAHLMALSAHDMRSAKEHTLDHLSHEHTAFTGHAATFLPAFCDAAVRNIERRIARAFKLPPRHVEPLSVLRYQSSDRYAAHVDYFDEARLEYNRRIGDKSGQRVASFLVYLRAPEEGGETHYIKLKMKIAGRPRMALCHFNCLPAGITDPMTLHSGEPVAKGEKWLARTTLREQPFF